MKIIPVLFLQLAFCTSLVFAQTKSAKQEKAQLLLRCDDIGMCHGVNMATKKIAETGIPFSASVMFACPWYQEAIDILKNQPQIAIGIHLTLGSEWKNYRWGPITGKSVVPSLVDSIGYFYPTPGDLIKRKPKIAEIEIEFRAQIDRALSTGLKIVYLDNHMGAGLYDEQQRQLLEKLAKEYKLGISGYFEEQHFKGFADIPFDQQKDSVVAAVQKLKPGKPYLMVLHLGLQGPEMDALQDSNEGGVKLMSQQRETELQMLLSPEFRNTAANHIELINYTNLVQNNGLSKMKKQVK